MSTAEHQKRAIIHEMLKETEDPADVEDLRALAHELEPTTSVEVRDAAVAAACVLLRPDPRYAGVPLKNSEVWDSIGTPLSLEETRLGRSIVKAWCDRRAKV